MNRIPELILAIKEVEIRRYGPGRIALTEAAPEVLKLLKERAPKGQNEPNLRITRGRADDQSFRVIERGRPSDRLHGVRMENAWEEPVVVEGENESLDLDFINTSPQMEILLAGSPKHDIFGVAFHWGAPLRWEPKDGFAPGPRYFSRVSHPGFPSFDWFIDQALDGGGEQEIERQLEISYTKFGFTPLDEMFTE